MTSFLENIQKLDLPKVQPLVIPASVKLLAERLGLAIELTCRDMPEQYELTRNGLPAGYIRSRRGDFSVDYPEAAEESLYEGTNDGYGGFTDHERETKLLFALGLIAARMMKV